MTTTPFDDPIAFHRRWGRLNPKAVSALADNEPLLFIADHISGADRREGCVAVAVRLAEGPSPLIVVPDGPTDPTDAQCLALAGTVVERSGGTVVGMGFVHHRRGGLGVTDTDRRWALALRAVCDAFSLEPLGVMARLYGGEVVRVPIPSLLPADYFDGMDI